MKHDPSSVDALVLATVNASYKSSISAADLVTALQGGQIEGRWLPHFATFFTEVSPATLRQFVDLHGVPMPVLVGGYQLMREASGETCPFLELELGGLGKVA